MFEQHDYKHISNNNKIISIRAGNRHSRCVFEYELILSRLLMRWRYKCIVLSKRTCSVVYSLASRRVYDSVCCLYRFHSIRNQKAVPAAVTVYWFVFKQKPNHTWSVITLNKQNKNGNMWRVQLVINSLHAVDGELEACSGST